MNKADSSFHIKTYDSYLNIFGLLLLFLSYYTTINPENVGFGSDSGLSFAIADMLLDGKSALLGPPVHIGGRQLTPFYYWYLSFYRYFFANPWQSVVAMSIVHFTVFLFCLIRIIKSLAPGLSSISYFLIYLCIYSSDTFTILRDPWHGYFIAIIAAHLFLFFTYTLQKGVKFFPGLILFSAILLQVYLATLPLILILITAALIKIKKQSGKISEIFKIHIAYALVIVSFIPTIIYELFYKSNLGILFGQHKAQIESSWFYFAASKYIKNFIERALFDRSLSEILIAHIAGIPYLLGLCLLFISYFAFKKLSGVRLYYFSTLLLIFITYLLLLAQLQPPYAHHYLNFLLIAPYIFLALYLIVIEDAIKGLVVFGRKFSLVSVMLIFLFFAAYLFGKELLGMNTRPAPQSNSFARVRNISEFLKTKYGKVDIIPSSKAKSVIYSIYYFLNQYDSILSAEAENFKELALDVKLKKLDHKILLMCPADKPQTRSAKIEELSLKYTVNNNYLLKGLNCWIAEVS